MRSCDLAHVHTTIRQLGHPAQAGGGSGILGDGDGAAMRARVAKLEGAHAGGAFEKRTGFV